MEAIRSEKYLPVLIAGIIGFFALFALWLRLLPMFNMGNADILTMVASDDPLYNLRQVEQLLANNLQYAWFDPMTLYPGGANMYWGPLFPLILAICCLVTGAATRPEIIGTAILVPPLMAVVIIVTVYYVGKVCGDWKTGILASGFTAIISGQFFYRSLYGYIDHHIAEVLFSTLFCLLYIYTMLSEKDEHIILMDWRTYRRTLVYAILAGVAYLLGLFTMPTMILFAMIVGIFTVIQFTIDVYRGRTSEYLLITNIVIFLVAICGLLVFGLKSPGIDLSTYSIGHIYAYLAVIGGTLYLYLLAGYLKGRAKYYYPASLAGSGIVFAAILLLVSPELFNLLILDFFGFFGQAAVTNTVQEARGWTLENAWVTFNYGLLLMLGGALVMFYNNLRDEHPHQVFALVWSLIMLVSTWQHIRYEYYIAVNVALLSAVCVSFCAGRGLPVFSAALAHPVKKADTDDEDRRHAGEIPKGKRQKKSHLKSGAPRDYQIVFALLTIVSVLLGLLFVQSSVSMTISNANAGLMEMNKDWLESLTWAANNTPETGVDYLRIYNPADYKAPDQSYGVMSWWDYGHLITYISKRIPNANPFQQGVAGPDGAAAYFLSTSEDTANAILDRDGTRYVITDIEMDTGKFWAMATWHNETAAISPYQMSLLTPVDSTMNRYQSALLNSQNYYLTTISRLHNFDGSMTRPTTVYYIEYADPKISGMSLPVMVNAIQMNATAAEQAVAAYNPVAQDGYHATILSPSIVAPVDTVPSLRHYRLVHESPTNVFNTKDADVKYVKIFEYVRGAHIRGDGIIEVPVISDTGRNFIYRQQSINGEFIVPYSTTGNPYEVKTSGKYRIAGTTQEFDVPESAVVDGLTIR